jgi:hypothetical protein
MCQLQIIHRCELHICMIMNTKQERSDTCRGLLKSIQKISGTMCLLTKLRASTIKVWRDTADLACPTETREREQNRKTMECRLDNVWLLVWRLNASRPYLGWEWSLMLCRPSTSGYPVSPPKCRLSALCPFPVEKRVHVVKGLAVSHWEGSTHSTLGEVTFTLRSL